MAGKLTLCNCMGSQELDSEALERATGIVCSRVHTALCTDDIAAAKQALEQGDAVIACQQERARFEALAEEIGQPAPQFIDLRDRAGWSDGPGDKVPKMAALIAEAMLPVPPMKTVDVESEGICLLIGAGEFAYSAAADLCGILSITVLLTDDVDPPLDRRFDVVRGRLVGAKGSLGGFEVRIEDLRELVPGGRGTPQFGEPRKTASSQCDIILDMSGQTPLFPAWEKRDGYLRADPGSPDQRAKAILAASQLVGTFEKPLHVRLDEFLCAHSRAGQVGCSKCLDNCPTGAILPDGDHVTVQPLICAGCGACSAICPSGAISFDAPPVETVFRRMETLARTYREQGGHAPRLIVHDTGHGAEMISLAARYGRGLPADVLPLSVAPLSAFGHAEMLGALASGFADISLILAPNTDRDVIEKEAAIARAIAGEDRITLLDLSDPEALPEHFDTPAPQSPIEDPVLALGSRRQITRLAAKALNPHADAAIALPEGSPYGAVLVDGDACTLCLSCVSLCPSGALVDNSDLPQLRFQEDACLQCGICRVICPEDAIAYEPRLNLRDEALAQTVLNEEEPFACVECGALFGVRSTINRISEQLAGKHDMFASSDAARMIQMCDDCRVKAQFHSKKNPFAAGERPRVRTTDDYIGKRRDN